MTLKTVIQDIAKMLLFFIVLIVPFFFASDVYNFLQKLIIHMYPQDVVLKIVGSDFVKAYLFLFTAFLILLPSLILANLDSLLGKQAEKKQKKLDKKYRACNLYIKKRGQQCVRKNKTPRKNLDDKNKIRKTLY